MIFAFEYPERRIALTNQLVDFIINERTIRGLSATRLAQKMDRPQSWIAQIENRRTQTIKQSDLLKIFENILEVDEEAVKQYLLNHVEIKIIDNIESKTTNEFNNSSPVTIYLEENPSDDYKLKNEYDKKLKHLLKGFETFYERIDNKQDALNIVQTLIANMHSDIGFALSVSALPLKKLHAIETSIKSEIYKSFIDIIDKYSESK